MSSLERALEHRLTRVVLACLVILSLLPSTHAAEDALRLPFLAIFGAELALRFRVWRRTRRPIGALGVFFVATDVMAWVSFLPLHLLVSDEWAEALALLRLVRLTVLLRFAQGLARDIYAIVTRREQLQQFGLVTGAVFLLSFVSAVILSQLQIPHEDRKAPRFVDLLWWSFRQIESPDNLVPTLDSNPILIVLSLALTVVGVFIISFVIGIGTNIVEQIVRAERRRGLAYHHHTLVTGPVHHSEVLLREFVRISAKNRQIPSPERFLTWLRFANPLRHARPFPRMALLGTRDEPPPFLWEPLMRGVVYRSGDAAEPESLGRVAAAEAKRAILLARTDLTHEADAVSIATLAALRGLNPSAQVLVEVMSSSTVPIVQQVGGPETVALDMPRLLGLFLVKHVVSPGIDRLFSDLLTADESELYTHVFTDEDERGWLSSSSQGASLPFAALARRALRDQGIHLVGVLLGEGSHARLPNGVVPCAGLVPWLNPHVLPSSDPRPAALGARAGEVPLRTLRGLIAIADSYPPVAAYGRALARASTSHAEEAVASDEPAGTTHLSLSSPPAPPRRIVLIGMSDALPALVQEVARFVPGVELTLFCSARSHTRIPLARRLADLEVGFEPHEPLPGVGGRDFVLANGGRLRVHTHDGPDLVGFAATLLHAAPPAEAAVFLSEPEGEERDARTALRMLRYVKLLEDGRLPRGATLHLLAEFISVAKGAHIQKHVDDRACGFPSADDVRVTLVSTDTVKNYFMVHSAFVPGITEVYGELLEERGQDLVRLGLRSGSGRSQVTTLELVDAARARGAVLVAVERTDRSLVLGPAADARFEAAELAGIYVMADPPHRAAQGPVASADPREPVRVRPGEAAPMLEEMEPA